MMAPGAHVLVVDDDEDILKLLTMRLRAKGFRITAVGSAEQALVQIAVDPPRVVVSDVRLPGIDGLALFEEIRRTRPTLPVILLTAHGNIPDAVAATSRGVFGYLTKPFDSQILLEKIDRALQLSAPTSPAGEAPSAAGKGDDAWMEGVIFRSSRMAELMAEARMVAASDASVLIRGESGSGKEVLARAIHRASPRAKGPFVAINCGAIPEQLLESELFGHERGAFTGAVESRKGRFEQAHGGTLFLDEIGEVSAPFQAKLLRILQEGEFERVGGSKTIKVDVRIIAATHRDLETAVDMGDFREDLFYRLNVMPLFLPPLRERIEDIPEIARHLLTKIGNDQKRKLSLTDMAQRRLASHDWPGNVRELENCLERAAVLSEDGKIDVDLIRFPSSRERSAPKAQRGLATPAPQEGFLRGAVNPVFNPNSAAPSDIDIDDPNLSEKERVIAALEQAGWVQAKAARILGMTPRQIAYRIQTLNIEVKQF